MLKRILICFFAFLMVLAAIPEVLEVNAADPGPVTYNRQILQSPVLTLQMTQDGDFLSNPDTKAAAYNYGRYFTHTGGWGLSNSQYNRHEGTYTFSFPDSLSTIRDIKNRGQLWIGYTLSMCPSRHSNISHVFTEKIGYQYTKIFNNYYNVYFNYYGADNIQNTLKNYGKPTDFRMVNDTVNKLFIEFGLNGSCTAHGNPYTTDASVYFADRKEPSISRITTTADKEGIIPKEYYGAGQKVYIHLEYDEPIRFSDNSPNHDNVTLALDVARKATASNAGVGTQYAKLVALNDTKLTFCYDIPATINNTAAGAEATDHYIAGIKESSLQSSLYGNGSFVLKYPTINGDMKLPQKYQSKLSYTKTDCLITDLAGNPAKSFSATRLWPYAYMDTVAPELAYIEIEGSMIDSNYTGELDAPDLDRSTVFAGVGDTVSFRVWFSEYIDMNIDKINIKPVLNIRDNTGNPVKFIIAGWGNGKRNKEDKFESGYLDFMGLRGLPMEEGMTPIEHPEVADKRITIDSLSIPSDVKLRDKSGNEFAQAGINIPKDLNITANKTVFLDVLKPVVTTSAELSEGKYTPIYYSGSDKLQFCFPVAAHDDTSAGPAYVSRISTKDGSGEFQWISAEPFNFKYKVTGSMDKPVEAPANWQTGIANNKYSFTQIAEGNYIHIALIDAENYNIADTTMKVYERDFAGNVGEGSFPLDYLYDTRGPDITKVSFETGTDSTNHQGYIKAAVKLEDPSMVDISSVYYKWVNNATGGSGDWQQYSGTVNTSAKTMTLDFSLTGLAKNTKHDYTLLIKARDHSAATSGGNETITDLSYLIDLTYPAYTFSHSEGYTAEPQFIIKDLLKNPDTGEESTVIVMIKDPAGLTGNEYFVRPITTGSYNGFFSNSSVDGDVLDHFYINSSSSSQESRFWRYHTITEGEEKQYIFDATAPTIYKLMSGTGAEKQIATRLQAIMGGKYYGNIEVKLITGYGRLGTINPVTLASDNIPAVFEAVYYDNGTFKYYSTASDNFKVLDIYEITVPVDGTPRIYFKALDLEGNIIDERLILGDYTLAPSLYSNFISYIPESANVDVKTYTLKADAPNYVLDGNGNQVQNTSGSIHSITLTPQSNDLEMAQGWTNPSDGSKLRSSIDNEVFSVDITNKVISTWGLNDINFDSENTYIGLFLISSPDDEAPVSSTVPIWKVTPVALASQSFTIPAGVAQYNGHYQVKVQLSSWGGGIDTAAVDCYVDRTGVTEFSPKAAKHSYDYITASGAVTISDTYSYTPADSCIYLGSQNGKKVTLSFGAESGPLSAEGIAYRQMFIKAWNALEETAENTAPEGARWYDISTGDFTREYQIRFFNTADELKSAVLGDANKAELGLLMNTENVVHYQIIGANGAASAVRTLFVDVSDELPDLEMELSPKTSAVNLQSATAFIKKLQSATMKEMVVKTVAVTPDTVGSEGYNIIDDKAHSFYTVNAYGNYAFDTVTAHFVDSEKPMENYTFAEFTFYGDMNYRNNLGLIYNDNMDADPSQIKLFLKYEDAYMARLQAQNGLAVNPEGYMQVMLPEIPAGQNSVTKEYDGETAPGGIYKIHVTKESPYYDGDKFNIWLYMDYLYDSSKAEEFNMPVSFYFEDQAGNRSEVFVNDAYGEPIEIKVLNRKPAITGAESNHDTIYSMLNTKISFNKPVKLISPDSFTHTNHDLLIKDYPQNSLPAGFEFSRDAFPVYGTGEYKVTFKDIFGITYIEDYTPVLNFDKYGLDVSFSTTEPVRGNIKVTIKPQSEGTDFYMHIVPPNTEYDKLEFSQTYGQYLKSATVTLSENGYFYLYLRAKKGEYNWDYKYLCIPVTNILSHAPEVQETWYYPEFASNTLPQGVTETTHMVTAFISSAYHNRPIQGAEGYNLSYTFPYGTNAGDAYTFQYTDAVGNIGTKTVYCPVSIVRPLLPQEDKEAPNFIVKVYGKYGDVFRETEAWNSPVTSTPYDADGNKLPPVTVPAVNSHTTFKELLDAVSWTRGYMLDFEVSDSSPTKLVLMKPGDTSEGMTYANAANYQSNISGVSINGNIVTVTDKDAEFKIAVVDDGNEHVNSGSIIEARAYSSVKEMSFGGADNWWIDLISPTAETAIEYSDFYRLVCFFRVSDTQSTPTVVSPLWTTMTDEASPFYTKYKDWYYKEFGENAVIDINFRDEAYNMATKTLEITGIDSSAPKAEVKWWKPSAYSIDWDGEVTQFKDQAPNHKTNSTVNAGVSFDKNITAMKLWRWDGAAYTDDAAEIAPYAALEQQADFAVISFFQGAKVKLTFTAQNGKSGELELTLGDVIDKTPPVVSVVTQNDTADSTKAVLLFSINEDVTDQTGKQYLVADGDFEKEITQRGTYEYSFTDTAGNTAKVSATVSNIDGAPPVVVFKDMPDENTSQKTSYTFKAAMNEAGTITMLDQTAIAAAPIDFVNGKPNLETITWHDFTVTQNGSYLVTGTDSAGNKSMYYVSIKCTDNTAPNIAMQPSTLKVRQCTETSELTDDILLSGVLITDTVSPTHDIAVNLNGKPTQADLDTVGVYTVNITATDKAGNTSEKQRYIQVYPKDEPEVLVNGIKTERDGTTVVIGTYVLNVSVDIPSFNGEPYTLYIRKGDKTAGQMKRNAAVIEGGTYTVAEDGYYTLYIVRQNREIYLTRLYIQK